MARRLAQISSVAFFVAALAAAGCSSSAVKRPFFETKAIDAANYASEAFASGDYTRAIDKYGEALQLDRALDNREAELKDLINLSRALLASDAVDKARPFLKDATALARVLKDDAALAEALATLASAYCSENEYESALKAVDESIAIEARLGAVSTEKLNIKGLALNALNRMEESEAVYKDSLKRALKDGNQTESANAQRALASFEAKRGNHAGAFELYSSAYSADKALGRPPRIASDLIGMAEAKDALGDAATAAFLFERAYIVSASAGLKATALKALDGLIGVYKKSGDNAGVARFSEIRDKLGAANAGKAGRQ